MGERRSAQPRRRVPDRRSGDRREIPRQDSEASIRFLRGGTSPTRPLSGELLDVSPIGIRLSLTEPVSQSESLLVEVRTADGWCSNLSARVVWMERLGEGGCRAGCQLLSEISDRQYAVLQRFVVKEGE